MDLEKMLKYFFQTSYLPMAVYKEQKLDVMDSYDEIVSLWGSPAPKEEPQRCNGGSLKPEYYGAWAKYVVKYIKAYLDAGIPVTMLSLQNETVAATMWDSCVWTAEESKRYLRDYLYPELQKEGLEKQIGIYIWDHNKERMIEHVLEVLDEETMEMVEGIAFHWYSGDHFESVPSLKAGDRRRGGSLC